MNDQVFTDDDIAVNNSNTTSASGITINAPCANQLSPTGSTEFSLFETDHTINDDMTMYDDYGRREFEKDYESARQEMLCELPKSEVMSKILHLQTVLDDLDKKLNQF